MKVGDLFNPQYETVYPSDYGLTLGCNPQQARIRANTAAKFFKRGGCKKIIVSGGESHDCNGARVPEYKIMRDELVRLGVPENVILDETRALDTVQNLVCGLDVICKDCDVFAHAPTVTVITEPYHMRRSLLLAKIFLPAFLTVYGYTQDTAAYLAESCMDGELQKQCLLEIRYIEGIYRYIGITEQQRS